MINLKELGLKVKQERKKKNLTQCQLAEKSNVSLITIKLIESGKINTTLETLGKIFEALNIKLVYRFKKEE